MKISPLKTVASEFMTTYNKTIANAVTFSNQDLERLYYLRASQLPFCPATVLTNFLQKGTVQKMDFLMAYYVSVGSAVHEVMQTYLAQSGKFLADYICQECGEVHKLSHKTECCGFLTKYNEVLIDVSTKSGMKMIGHIDGIFLAENGKYWILDFKTTSVSGAVSKQKDPGANYIEQVEAYAFGLKKQYGITVEGVMLVFIPRDDPKKIVVWEKRLGTVDFKRIGTRLKAQLILHKRTMEAKTSEEVKELLKYKCGNHWCRACTTTNAGKLDLTKLPIRRSNKSGRNSKTS